MRILNELLKFVAIWYASGLIVMFGRITIGFALLPGAGTDLWLKALDASDFGRISRFGNEIIKTGNGMIAFMIGLTVWPERLCVLESMWQDMKNSYTEEYERLTKLS